MVHPAWQYPGILAEPAAIGSLEAVTLSHPWSRKAGTALTSRRHVRFAASPDNRLSWARDRQARRARWVFFPSPFRCQLCAGSPPTICNDARASRPPPTHHLVRRPGDPVGVARAIAEPRTGIGERNQLDRDLHDPGFQVDRRGRRWRGARACIGPRAGPLPVLLTPRAGPGDASRERFGATACTAGARVSVGLPGRASDPACLGECAASRTSAFLLIA
jgi:hypothetical protein